MKKLLATATLLGVFAIGAPALAADHKVKMLDAGADGMMVFEPGFLKVQPGDTVTFEATNPSHNAASHLIPDGAKPWSGAMGKPVTVKLDKEGVYIYKCDPHVPLGMVGVIQVGKASNLAEAKKSAEEFKGSIALNKERLDKYLGQVK